MTYSPNSILHDRNILIFIKNYFFLLFYLLYLFMYKKDLIKQIYILSFPKNNSNYIINLNINRGKYIIKEALNVREGLLISKSNKNGEEKINYVDDLSIFDQLFIYKKLLLIDIFKSFKKIYPERNNNEINILTTNIYKNIHKNKKIIHRNFIKS